jgi:tetratricopeptide (TPR) repeat protein
MAKKLTREELKRDEVLETVGRGIRFVSSHRRGTAEAIGVSAALVLLIAAFLAFRAHRESQAGEHLSRALTILSTPLASDVPAGGEVPARTYASAGERRADADKELAAAADFGATRAGREARVLLTARGQGGKDAESQLEAFARGGKTILSAAAEINAVRLLASQGKTTEAITELKRAIESSDTAAPKDLLLFELAGLYEKSGALTDAKATYQRILSDYPESLYRSEAQTRTNAL